jgi:hypothetical protein
MAFKKSPLRLKHTLPNELPEQRYYFYDGEAIVHFGVIEIPRDGAHQHWAQRAWMKGYRIDPKTGQELSLEEVLRLTGK